MIFHLAHHLSSARPSSSTVITNNMWYMCNVAYCTCRSWKNIYVSQVYLQLTDALQYLPHLTVTHPSQAMLQLVHVSPTRAAWDIPRLQIRIWILNVETIFNGRGWLNAQVSRVLQHEPCYIFVIFNWILYVICYQGSILYAHQAIKAGNPVYGIDLLCHFSGNQATIRIWTNDPTLKS